MQTRFDDIALLAPEILLPKAGTDLTAWAVVACDQYTSQPEYWETVDRLIGDKPSALRLMLPEAYLETEKEKTLLPQIAANMRKYLDGGLLRNLGPGFVLVDRQTGRGASRKGLVVALDLEHYDYNAGSTTLIRATEGTILERLPPRIKVREQAVLEMPHIMVLIDDPGRTVIEPLCEKRLETVYDFELMQRSGHLTGRLVNREEDLLQVAGALGKLAEKSACIKRYGFGDKPTLLYAMGDGNHSLATAKAVWENLKSRAPDRAAAMNHPARHALVELVNLHDAGMEFEPIHRVLFGVDPAVALDAMRAYFAACGREFSIHTFRDRERLLQPCGRSDDAHAIPFVAAGKYGELSVQRPERNLPVATLQDFLDEFLRGCKTAKIDYVHGAEVALELGSREGNLGFLLPALDKRQFFPTVILDGALPRKTFSMGEADEKRFYLECRRIA